MRGPRSAGGKEDERALCLGARWLVFLPVRPSGAGVLYFWSRGPETTPYNVVVHKRLLNKWVNECVGFQVFVGPGCCCLVFTLFCFVLFFLTQ